MLHTQNEEDSSAGRGVGRDFFQVFPENNREYSPGIFPQEVRKEIPTFARKQSWGGLGMEGILLQSFYTKSRQDVPPRVGRTVLGHFKERRLSPPLSSDSWGRYPGLPPNTIWEVSPPPFVPKQGRGEVLGSLPERGAVF